MSLLFTNNAVSTLAAGIGTGDTSLTVQAADGGLFPFPTGNDSFLITLRDAANNIEIVECTTRSGDALTIVRAREGTTAKAYLSGDAVELSVTAGVLSQYRQGVGDGVINTAISLALGAIHRHQIINCTASGITISLGDAATMAEGYQVIIKNSSTGDITVTRATPGDTIDGVAGTLNVGAGATIYMSVNENETGYISLFNGAAGAYPVGALFFAGVATNPSVLLGFGTWEAIEGRFIVGVGDNGDGMNYTNGAQGGSKDAVVVSHSHGVTDPGHAHTGNAARENGNDGSNFGNTSRATFNAPSTNTAVTGIAVNSSGVSGTDQNLPPYEGAYIWRRTA